MLVILKLGTQRQEDPWYFLTSHLNLFGKLQSSKKSCLKILQVKKKKKILKVYDTQRFSLSSICTRMRLRLKACTQTQKN